MCGAELHSLPEGVQRVARLLHERGHPLALVTLTDRELFRFDEIWAAAGNPHGGFMLRPQDLERLTGAPVADVVLQPAAA